MKLLTFQAPEFSWTPFSQTLDDADPPHAGTVEGAVVVFLHIEAEDEATDARKRAFRHTLKHIKWLANKRDLRNIVLHSFTHLGGVNASATFARAFMDDMAERLSDTGYAVQQTPFGWFCSWQLSVAGDSLAKVFKQI